MGRARVRPEHSSDALPLLPLYARVDGIRRALWVTEEDGSRTADVDSAWLVH
jgi:hypothetical protein